MMPYLRKLGLGASVGQQAVSAGGAVGSSVVGALMAAGTIAGPVGLAIDAGIAAVSLAINAIMNSGCGQTCIVSTQFANQAENLMKQNIAAYFAIPAPRPYEDQQAALGNFDGFWTWLQAPGQCGNPQLGSAGQRCITDREAGACKWTVTTPNPWPGQPGPGQCFNWFSGYRDPIANDPNVAPPVSASSVASALTSGTVAGLPAWLVFAGAALGVWVLAEAL